MDNLTKAFVIAASSVLIAVGGVWLYRQYVAHQSLEICISEEVVSQDALAHPWNQETWWTDKTPSQKRENIRYKCVMSLRIDGIL